MATALAIDRWRVPLDELRAELARGQKPNEIVCLGCAAKVELVSTVYPVLAELALWLREKTKITLQPRDDVYLFPTDGTIEITRGTYSIADLAAGRTEQVTADVRRARPTGLVVLANFTPFPTKDKLKKAFFNFYEAADRAGIPFTVGKGHTIQIATHEREEYMVAEYVRSTGATLYGVANNDTISTIDPNLEYASWVSLFVAMNNALNDIFLSGVYRGIRIYPTVDAREPGDLPKIRAALSKYAQFLAPLGIDIVDLGPLGYSTKSMGATVVGVTDREVPINQRLLPGQILIATRAVGDLAPLTEILIKQSLEEDVEDLQPLREKVLSEMLTPSVEVAKLIARYLPAKGQPFDRAKHVMSCRDMTGPGILAVEELAQDSGNDVYLDDLQLHDERVADVEMPNPTSGTNGAIIIGADAAIAKRIRAELADLGYAPWVMGRVEAPSKEPRILINRRLEKYGFLKGVKKGIFDRYDFVDARSLPDLGR